MRCLRWTSMLRRQPASMDHQDLDKGRLPAIDNGATKLSFQARLTLSKFTIGNYFQVEIKAMSIGATPPANGDAMTWASEVKQSPLPFEKHLTSITNLFNSQYLNGEDFWKDANLHQIDELKTLFTMVLNEYCATLLSKGKTWCNINQFPTIKNSSGEVYTCADEVPGGIFPDQYIFGINEGEETSDYFNRSLIGHKSNRSRLQCSLDCISHADCVAMSWRAELEDMEPTKEGTCYLFKQANMTRFCLICYSQSQGSPLELSEANVLYTSGQYYTMIYPEKMNPSLFEQLRFENLYISDSPRSSHAVQTSVDCQSLCSNDPVCAIAVFCSQQVLILDQTCPRLKPIWWRTQIISLDFMTLRQAAKNQMTSLVLASLTQWWMTQSLIVICIPLPFMLRVTRHSLGVIWPSPQPFSFCVNLIYLCFNNKSGPGKRSDRNIFVSVFMLKN